MSEERNEDELSNKDTTESVYEDAMSLHTYDIDADDQFLEAVDLFQEDLTFSAGNPGLPINLADNSLSLDEIEGEINTIPAESGPSQQDLSQPDPSQQDPLQLGPSQPGPSQPGLSS